MLKKEYIVKDTKPVVICDPVRCPNRNFDFETVLLRMIIFVVDNQYG